jgi:hypothetical protein
VTSDHVSLSVLSEQIRLDIPIRIRLLGFSPSTSSEAACLNQKKSPNRPVVTPSQLIKIVRGIASQDTRARFLEAYNDPTSELHEVLLGMEEWSHSLPGGQSGAAERHSGIQRKKFSERFELFEQFVHRKHAENLLTAAEAERVLKAGGSIELENSTPRQVMAAIARMARELDAVQPHLHAELVEEIRARESSRIR